MTLEESLTAFFEALPSPHSRRGYRDDWKRFVEWLQPEKLDVISTAPVDIKRYMTLLAKDKGRATRGRALSVIRSVYDSIVSDGLLAYNPARSVKNPKKDMDPQTQWLPEEEMWKVVDALSTGNDWEDRRERMCVLLFIGTTRRRAEVARMRVEDFRDKAMIGVVKGGKKTIIATPEWLRMEIEDWCALAGISSGPILPRALGCDLPISESFAYDLVKRAAKRVGLEGKTTPHALRRTSLTLGYLHGASVEELKMGASHANQATTERYIKAARAAQKSHNEWMTPLMKLRTERTKKK